MPINDINRDSTLAFVSNEYTSLRFKEIGAADSTYLDVPGITDWNISGTNTPVRDVVDARGPSQKRRGHMRVPEVSVSSLYLPQNRAWRRLKEAQENNTLLTFRIETNGTKVWETSVATDLATKGLRFVVAATGAVTITAQTGAGNESLPTIEQAVVGQGSVLAIKPNTGANKLFVVDEVTEDATTIAAGITVLNATTYAAPTAITGTDHHLLAIWNPPPLRLEFVGSVTQGADMSLPAESELTTELMLQPRGKLPDWTIFTF